MLSGYTEQSWNLFESFFSLSCMIKSRELDSMIRMWMFIIWKTFDFPVPANFLLCSFSGEIRVWFEIHWHRQSTSSNENVSNFTFLALHVHHIEIVSPRSSCVFSNNSELQKSLNKKGLKMFRFSPSAKESNFSRL